MAQVIPVSPEGQTMARGSSSTNPCTLFDPLGYARITNLRPNGWRIKAFNSLVTLRGCGVCILEKVLPSLPPEPVVLTPVNEAWSALKDIDEVFLNLSMGFYGPMTTGADLLDASFKLCLCFPCAPSPPTSLLYEGQTDFILPKPSGAKEMLYGPELKKTTSLFITDERTCCQRMCGCKKGTWTIYNDNKEVVARVGKGKKCCTCASYYQMKDRDGVMLARIKVSPTFCECLNQTCRKLTCQCCCCCRLCDCLRCKCCASRPDAKILAPTKKEMLSLYNKAKCCKAPKSKVIYRTLYIPGQGGEAVDPEEVLADDEIEKPPPGAEVADEPVEGGDYSKYNKQCKGPDVGLPGAPLKYYVKKPPYCCVGLKREVLKMTCCSNVGEYMEMAEMAAEQAEAAGVDLEATAEAAAEQAGVDPEAIAAARAAAARANQAQTQMQELTSSTTGGNNNNTVFDAANAEANDVLAIKEAAQAKRIVVAGKTAGMTKLLKNYKKVKDECDDIQYGETFTTAQKAGALLYILWEDKKHQQ